MRTEPDTKENGFKVLLLERARVFKFGQMAHSMRVGGKTTRLMAKVVSSMLMEIFMMDSGRMTRHMDTASILILTEPDIKVIGKKTNNTEKVSKHGPMVQAMKETISKARNMVLASSHGLMAAHIKDSSTRTISRDKGSINGQMDVSMRVNGRTIKWKAWEFSPGQMVASTKVNISMIRKKEKESFSGRMVENTRETGRMENSMELVFTLLLQAKPREESGMKAKESHGLIDRLISITL